MKERVSIRECVGIAREEWDEIVASYPSATIFHLSCWHDVLEESRPGKVVRFEVEYDGRVCGHWCGFLLTKFGVHAFGAPLPGIATDYMHPLFLTPPPTDEFLDAVVRWAKGQGVGMVDLGGDYFTETELTSKGFRTYCTESYKIDLSAGESEIWKRLKPAMRNKVRKAEKKGIRITDNTPTEFPARFFAMLEDVFNRQASVPSYSLELIETVVRILSRSGHVKTFTAWHDDKALASIILLMNATTAYFWGGASYPSAYPVGANDLIHWQALRFAAGRGLLVYDTCGGGDYKKKFGGPLITLPAGYLPLNPLLSLTRSFVRQGFRAKQLVLGRLRYLEGTPRDYNP